MAQAIRTPAVAPVKEQYIVEFVEIPQTLLDEMDALNDAIFKETDKVKKRELCYQYALLMQKIPDSDCPK